MDNINNKYMKWYWDICNRAKDRILLTDIYTEKHHIYPKSIYGKNDMLVKLTAKEHYMVHLLLWRGLRTEYGTTNSMTRKMACAFTMMNMKSNQTKQRYDSHAYVFYSIACSESKKGKPLSEQAKQNIRKSAKNRPPISDETRQKMSISQKANPGMLGKHHTEEAKRKVSEAKLGMYHTEEAKRKISESSKGKIVSEETKQRMSNAKQNMTDETKQKMSASAKGKHKSEEHKRKLSDVNKGKIHSEETRQKISNSNKGKKQSAETRQRLSDINKGHYVSEETKAKISLSRRNFNERKRLKNIDITETQNS